MNNPTIIFTEHQGVILIQLILAQLISDFVLQTNAMARNKRWISWHMVLHIALVFICAALFTGLWKLALAVAMMHWLIDSMKAEMARRNTATELVLFVGDQVLHIIVTVLLWAYYFDVTALLFKSVALPFVNYEISLILLGYAVVIWPVSYLIRFATQGMVKVEVKGPQPPESNAVGAEKKIDDKIEHGGRRIGQFERAIILTFVLLQQYEAIGFLITGKSIIRFAQRDENLRSEYVLVGTMMSYAFSIITGVLLRWLMNVAT